MKKRVTRVSRSFNFTKKIKSENLGHKYLTKEFFLPFKRLDVNLGWKANENSKRAHYVEIIEENIIALSGLGEIIIFKKITCKIKN